jgi:hypothetical protein
MLEPIHRSAQKENSANFALTEFSEVRMQQNPESGLGREGGRLLTFTGIALVQGVCLNLSHYAFGFSSGQY